MEERKTETDQTEWNKIVKENETVLEGNMERKGRKMKRNETERSKSVKQNESQQENMDQIRKKR